MSLTSCRWIIVQMVTTVYLYRPMKCSDPLDITFYSSTPGSSNVRGYAIGNSKTTDLSIGILNKNNKDNVTWADTGNMGDDNTRAELTTSMPNNKIFETPSNIAYRVHNAFVFLAVRNLQSSQSVGVFSFEATKSTVVTRSAIVVTSSSASIRMLFRTMTVGIGESVTIALSKGGGNTNLRWRHNYGDAIQIWNGDSSVTIGNIRAKDDGVYECYTGNTPDNNRGVMRLIVRDCPLPKWSPPQCEMDCPVCYNGGVCDDKTGLCICPAGFKGDYCEIGCGSNDWGRDCNLLCSSGNGEACRGALFCPPDPVGCACIDGYGGNDCNIVCDSSHYGADCRQVCHCDSGGCDRKTGNCTSRTCAVGYTGPACQELMSDQACPSGFFGVLCNYPCHCKDSADCNRDGSCGNGCHEAWAGADCSIALPYSSNSPTIEDQTATTLKIAACIWDPVQDFGTGNITGCNLWYKTSQKSAFTTVNNIENGVYIIDNLLPHTTVEFYTRHSRLVGGVETNGPPSEGGSAETICTKPLHEPEIELKTVDGSEIILTLKPVSSAPAHIQCDDILRYQVRYQRIDGNEEDIVNTTDGSQTEVKISGLSECNNYNVDSRVVNNEEFVGNWGEPVLAQTVPSVPTIRKDSVFGETYLLMKWNAATCNNQDQVIYHYQLSGGTNLQGSTTETNIFINEEILPCTQYTFAVLASHLNVNGTPNIKEITSAVEYPGIPKITSLSATSSSIDIRWSPPVDGNPCEIIQYNVSIESCLLSVSQVTIDTYLHIEEKIYSKTLYSVKVAAENVKGYGNYSSRLLIETEEKRCKCTVYIVVWILSTAVLLIFTAYLVSLIRTLKKTNPPITKESNLNDTPIYYVNENNVMSQADEVTYETLKPTEQDSYEQLTYKQHACDSSTNKTLDGPYANLPPP